MEIEGWEQFKGRLPKSHEWICVGAVKEKKKGRPKGGFAIGIRKDWRKEGWKILGEKEEGIVLAEIGEENKEKNIIILIYNIIRKKEYKKENR